jgi:hypothetical protein
MWCVVRSLSFFMYFCNTSLMAAKRSCRQACAATTRGEAATQRACAVSMRRPDSSSCRRRPPQATRQPLLPRIMPV